MCHVDFTSAQLNDVGSALILLESLRGRITGVDYNSEAPRGAEAGNAAPGAR